jgi:hypothetical protein
MSIKIMALLVIIMVINMDMLNLIILNSKILYNTIILNKHKFLAIHNFKLLIMYLIINKTITRNLINILKINLIIRWVIK